MQIEDARIMLSYLDVSFGRTLKKCEGKQHDCKLFVSIYNNLVDAIEEFHSYDIDNPIIQVGFHMIYKEKFEELKSLEKSLQERNMV